MLLVHQMSLRVLIVHSGCVLSVFMELPVLLCIFLTHFLLVLTLVELLGCVLLAALVEHGSFALDVILHWYFDLLNGALRLELAGIAL